MREIGETLEHALIREYKDELKNITVYPAFIKDEIHSLDGEIKHFVYGEL